MRGRLHSIAVAIVVLVAATVGGSQKAIAQCSYAPGTAPEFDFGEAESGSIVEHECTVKNNGDGILQISKITPGCGCTVAKMVNNEIAPGRESKLSAMLNLTRQKGLQRRGIVLETNDPQQPQLQLILKGKAVPRVAVTPERLDLNSIDNSRSANFAAGST